MSTLNAGADVIRIPEASFQAGAGLITFSEAGFPVGTVNPTYNPADYGGGAGAPTVFFGGYFVGQSMRFGFSEDIVVPGVPEPTTLALVGLGLVAIARRRRA